MNNVVSDDTPLLEFIDSNTEDALLKIGILTFNYYPQEKILAGTKSFSDFFNVDQVLYNMPGSLADALIQVDDHIALFEMDEELCKGNTRVSAKLRTNTGYISKVTITATEFDEYGRIKVAQGIVQRRESDIRSTKALEALSSDYSSVYYVDFDKNKVFPHRLSEDIEREYGVALRKNPPYDVIIKTYIENTVLDVERKEMEYICSYENLKNQFKDKKIYVHDYRAFRNGEIRYCRMKVVNLSDPGDFKYFTLGFSDMTAEKTVELHQYAYVDSLTGGNSYYSFKKKVQEISLPGVILSMDIYKFSAVNTVCGVKRGDEVLKKVWEICNECCCGRAICGHVSADIFSFYLTNMYVEEIVRHINKLTESLAKLSDNLKIPKLIPYFGVSKWTPNKEIETAYNEAIIAKNAAKKALQSDINYHFYTDDESERMLFDKNLEDNFAKYLENGNFEVWYQPKFNPFENNIIGAEALIRLRIEDGTLLPPVKFIPLFENNGLIAKLDRYVFKTVCRFQKTREENNKQIFPISINLSRASLFSVNVVERYTKIAEDIGINPALLPIEITESATVANSDIMAIMLKFHNAGFPIYMDDFGTGYSSLAILNTLPFDALKIDKSLVDYIGDSRGDKVLEHVVQLGQDLGMTITAEGVETEKQVDFLKKLQCDIIQGYYYAKPMPEKDFRA